MRTFILIMLISILGLNNLTSQNIIDPAKLPVAVIDTIRIDSIVTRNVNFNDTTIYRKNFDRVIIGWNHGNEGWQLDSIYGINHYLRSWESGVTYSWQRFGRNNNWYIAIRPIATNDDATITKSASVYYFPSITPDTSDSFTPGSQNANGRVYGFRDKDQNLTTSNHTVITNQNCSTTQPILKNVWPKNVLKFWASLPVINKDYQEGSRIVLFSIL